MRTSSSSISEGRPAGFVRGGPRRTACPILALAFVALLQSCAPTPACGCSPPEDYEGGLFVTASDIRILLPIGVQIDLDDVEWLDPDVRNLSLRVRVGDELYDGISETPDGTATWRLDRAGAVGEPLPLSATWSHANGTGEEIDLLFLEIAIERTEFDRRVPLPEDAFVSDAFDDDADGVSNLDELRRAVGAIGTGSDRGSGA